VLNRVFNTPDAKISSSFVEMRPIRRNMLGMVSNLLDNLRAVSEIIAHEPFNGPNGSAKLEIANARKLNHFTHGSTSVLPLILSLVP
jgi:hypothetical protein